MGTDRRTPKWWEGKRLRHGHRHVGTVRYGICYLYQPNVAVAVVVVVAVAGRHMQLPPPRSAVHLAYARPD